MSLVEKFFQESDFTIGDGSCLNPDRSETLFWEMHSLLKFAEAYHQWRSQCRCTVEQTTGTTQFELCNICGGEQLTC